MKPLPSLLPLSWIYGCGIVLRNMFFEKGIFRSTDVGVPVISVGNLTAGGTGKTPLVDLIARTLLNKGLRVAIVSRGYGRRTRGAVVVSDGQQIRATASEGGDEPLFLARKNPAAVVIADEQRVRGARMAVERFGSEIVLLDDAFQHRAIRRTLDVVLVDGNHPPFGVAMLPAGTRREPLRSLGRADVVVVTKVEERKRRDEIAAGIKRYSEAPLFMSTFRPLSFRRAKTGFSVQMQSAREKKAVVFCGIAQPESFRKTVETAGIEIAEFFAFEDHYFFTPADMETIIASGRKHDADYIVTTEKDLTRCTGESVNIAIEEAPVFYFEMGMALDHSDEWNAILFAACGR
jgi:tetraacyldisaccharide 4'-kinase